MSLFNLSPAEFCEATKACEEGGEFALNHPTMADVWDNCPRPDWLLWIVDTIGKRPDDRTLRLFAIWCARNTPLLDGRKTGDVLKDICSSAGRELAERFADGRATGDELATAGATAWYAELATEKTAAWDAAADAAWAAAWTSERAAAGSAAGDDPWGVAWAAQATHLRTLVPNPFRKETQP
jgi:hypothetical protein